MCKIRFSFLLLMLAFLFGCGKKDVAAGSSPAADTFAIAVPAVCMPQLNAGSFLSGVEVTFNGNTATLSPLPQGVDAVVEGANVTLSSSLPGVHYKISGTSENGSLTIISEHSPLVTVDGLNLKSCGVNTLQVSSRDVIYFCSKGDNFLADSASDSSDKQAAVLKFMGRSLLAGEGSLSLTAARGTAILSTDTLFVNGSQISVLSAPKNAISAGKALVVCEGNFNLRSAKDVVKVKSGAFYISGGNFLITAEGSKADALQADAFYMTAGVFNAVVGGAAADGIKTKGMLCVAGGTIAIQTSGDALYSEKKFDYSSASCFKSDSCIYIMGGNLSLESNGAGAKGISCDGRTYVTGGTLRVVTRGSCVEHEVDLNAHASSKGIKSDSTLVFSGGSVEVLVLGSGERAEGVESKGNILVCGNASVYIYAYDDALNAGSNFTISGGTLYAYSVANDAIDSNGTIDVNGGVLVADGSFSPEQGIDTDVLTDFTIRGGTVFSVGGAMGSRPALPLGKETASTVLSWGGLDFKKGSYVTIAGADGRGLLSYSLARDLNGGALLVSAPCIGGGCNVQLTLADSIAGGTAIGCGLYSGGTPLLVYNIVEIMAKAPVNVVYGNKVEYISPDTVTSAGMMPPPPANGHRPSAGTPPPPPSGLQPPPPPPGGFPPFPVSRDVWSEYSEWNLPNYRNV